MKKMILTVVMLLSAAGMQAIEIFGGQSTGCLPQGTSFYDAAAQKWASYENCIKSNMCGMMAPTGLRNSPKYGPGHPLYEQYKACAIKNNQKPAAVIYGR